jgi:Mg2+ and Co2+ transporter CorA
MLSIERVVHHVRRMEQNAETAVQMHFRRRNSHNDIMHMTGVAVFLPMNLITRFGMNTEFCHHPQLGQVWWTFGLIVLPLVVVVSVFWRKQYLARTSR